LNAATGGGAASVAVAVAVDEPNENPGAVVAAVTGLFFSVPAVAVVPKENPGAPLVSPAAVAAVASFVPVNVDPPKENPGAVPSLTPSVPPVAVFGTTSSSAPTSEKEGTEGCNPFDFFGAGVALPAAKLDGPGVLGGVMTGGSDAVVFLGGVPTTSLLLLLPNLPRLATLPCK